MPLKFYSMKAIIDTNYFIHRKISEENVEHAFIPSSVEYEIKDKLSKEYYEIFSFKIEVRDPSNGYVRIVEKAVANKHLGISKTDIDVVALTLEMIEEESTKWIGPGTCTEIDKVVCLSMDNGIKSALQILGICSDEKFLEKRYRMRCYTCYKMYDQELDFCTECGYPTVTRVTVIGSGELEQVMLSKYYIPRKKVIKDRFGNVIKSSGQREYLQYVQDKMKRNKKSSLTFM